MGFWGLNPPLAVRKKISYTLQEINNHLMNNHYYRPIAETGQI